MLVPGPPQQRSRGTENEHLPCPCVARYRHSIRDPRPFAARIGARLYDVRLTIDVVRVSDCRILNHADDVGATRIEEIVCEGFTLEPTGPRCGGNTTPPAPPAVRR